LLHQQREGEAARGRDGPQRREDVFGEIVYPKGEKGDAPLGIRGLRGGQKDSPGERTKKGEYKPSDPVRILPTSLMKGGGEYSRRGRKKGGAPRAAGDVTREKGPSCLC